jgi:hypothetical protein
MFTIVMNESKFKDDTHQLDGYFRIYCLCPIYTGPVSNIQQRKEDQGKVMIFQ